MTLNQEPRARFFLLCAHCFYALDDQGDCQCPSLGLSRHAYLTTTYEWPDYCTKDNQPLGEPDQLRARLDLEVLPAGTETDRQSPATAASPLLRQHTPANCDLAAAEAGRRHH